MAGLLLAQEDGGLMLTPAEWVLFLLLFVFIITLALGIEVETLGPFFLMLCGVTAWFLAAQAYAITANIPIATLLAGVGLLIFVAAISDLAT